MQGSDWAVSCALPTVCGSVANGLKFTHDSEWQRPHPSEDPQIRRWENRVYAGYWVDSILRGPYDEVQTKSACYGNEGCLVRLTLQAETHTGAAPLLRIGEYT